MIAIDISDETKKQREEIAKEKAAVKEIKKNLPSVADVVTYTLSQEKYRHSTFDLMNHFFGRSFKARGVTEGLYHDFLRLATNARDIIINERGGNFRYHLEMGRHKIYEWTNVNE